MTTSGQRTRVSTAAIGGVLDPVTKKLADSMDAAASSADKASKATEKRTQEESKASERYAEAVRSTVSTVQSVASGAIRSLGQAGSGATDAFYSAQQGFSQGGARQIGQTLGSFFGPPGQFIGGLLGDVTGAGVERELGPQRIAREQAIAQTAAAFGPAAAQGVQITKEEYREVFLSAFRLALAEQRNLAGARASADGGF